MMKNQITFLIRKVLKETFNKSEDVAPKTVNNLQGNEPLVIKEPYELSDASKAEEIGDPLNDIVLNALSKSGKVSVQNRQQPKLDKT